MRARRRLLALVTVIALVAMLAPSVASGAFVSPRSVVWWEDKWEPDDTPAQARALPAMSRHTIHDLDDEDWGKFTASAGQVFTFEMLIDNGNPMGSAIDYGDPDSEIEIYRRLPSGEATLVAGNDDSDLGDTYTSALTFKAPVAGTYYVRAHELSDDDRIAYTLYWNQGLGRRIAGATRYDTAIAASRVCFPMNGLWFYGTEDPERVVVASGESYADAMAGAAFAAGMEGAFLYTKKDSFPAAVGREIERLWTDDYILGEDEDLVVYILGSENTISEATARAIGSLPLVSDVVRLEGDDRYETAAAIATEFDDYEGTGSTAFVINGTSWADGLSATPVAAENDWPILLTRKSDVPQATMDVITALGITDVVVVGDTTAIDATAFGELETALGIGNVTRIAGSNRYATSRLLAEYGLSNGLSSDAMVVASGMSWVDAMPGGVLAYYAGSPLLLTSPAKLSSDVKKFMDDEGMPSMSASSYGLGYDEGRVSYLMGGSATIPNSVFNEWASYY